MGKQTSEWVILRCHVKIRRSLCEKNSRKTSESGKNRAEHERPSDDSLAIQWLRAEHVLPAKRGLGDERARDAVSDGVHAGSLQDCWNQANFI